MNVAFGKHAWRGVYPQHVLPFSRFLDQRDNPVNETFWRVALGGTAVAAVPAIVYAVARSSRRKAEAL